MIWISQQGTPLGKETFRIFNSFFQLNSLSFFIRIQNHAKLLYLYYDKNKTKEIQKEEKRSLVIYYILGAL